MRGDDPAGTDGPTMGAPAAREDPSTPSDQPAARTRTADTGPGPSFDCEQASGQVQELICATPELAALDRRLDAVWTVGMDRMTAGGAPEPDLRIVRAEQRGWISGRDDCWKSESVEECTRSAYRTRIAQLEVSFGLAAAREPVFWTCMDNPANEFVTTLFDTDPPGIRVERGDRQEVFLAVRTASGSRYVGSFGREAWMKGSEATFVWPQTDTLRCVVR